MKKGSIENRSNSHTEGLVRADEDWHELFSSYVRNQNILQRQTDVREFFFYMNFNETKVSKYHKMRLFCISWGKLT